MRNPTFLKKAMLSLFLLTAGFAFSQTAIKVIYYTGTEQIFTMEDSGKLYFSGDDLMIAASSGATATSIPTTIIQKIVFTNALATSEMNVDKKLVLYPNPSSDVIRVSTWDKSTVLNVKIYTVNGQLVYETKSKSGEDINISKLVKGIYVVNVNGSTIKLIKK